MQTGRRQAPMDIPPSHEQITLKAFPSKEHSIHSSHRFRRLARPNAFRKFGCS
jgi:hypothetical protein